MSKRTAMTLLFVAAFFAPLLAYVGLSLIGAVDRLFTLFVLLILCGGAHLSSRIVMHYGASTPAAGDKRPHKRPRTG